MNSTDSKPLTTGQTLAYALPAFPLALPTLVLFITLPTLYFEEFGLGLALTGVILMLARLGDLILDPLVGSLSDRIAPKTHRLMILIGGLICAPGLLLTVYPWSNWIGLSLFLGLTLLYFGWTLIQIPYLSLLPRLHRTSYERTRIASWREGLGVIGLLCSAAIPAALITLGLTSLEALRWLVILTLSLGLAALAILLTQLNWPSNLDRHLSSDWRSVMKNVKAKRLLGSWFSNGLANGIPAVLFPLYITHVLKLPEESRSYLILLYFLCAILSLPLWLWLSRKIDKDKLWKFAMLIAIAAFFPAAFLSEGDQALFYIVCIVTGFTLGADLALPQAMQADITDWHRLSFGQNQTGLLFALWNMATKLALALSALIALGLIDLFGFDPNIQGSGHLALIYAFLPCVFKAVAVVQLNSINLSQSWHQSVVQGLKERGI